MTFHSDPRSPAPRSRHHPSQITFLYAEDIEDESKPTARDDSPNPAHASPHSSQFVDRLAHTLRRQTLGSLASEAGQSLSNASEDGNSIQRTDTAWGPTSNLDNAYTPPIIHGDSKYPPLYSSRSLSTVRRTPPSPIQELDMGGSMPLLQYQAHTQTDTPLMPQGLEVDLAVSESPALEVDDEVSSLLQGGPDKATKDFSGYHRTVSLSYRTSKQAALSCAHVTRNPPRMRRRKEKVKKRQRATQSDVQDVQDEAMDCTSS